MDDHPDRMFCPSCGEKIDRSDRFCRHCGARNTKTHRWGPDDRRPPNRPADETKSPGESGAPDQGHGGRHDRRRGPPRDPPEQPRGESGHPRRRTGRDPVDWESGPQADPAQPETDLPWRVHLPHQLRNQDESTLRVVGVALGLGLFGMLLLGVFTLLVGGVGNMLGFSFPVVLLLGTVVGQYIGFMGMSLWYLRRRGLSWQSVKSYLGIRKPTLKEIGIIFGAWLLIMVGILTIGIIVEIISELLGSEPGEAEQEATRIFADNPEYVPVAIVMMFLVVGPCEEILFRGVIQGRLRERLSAPVAIAIASVFFALIHAPGFAGSIDGIILGLSVLTVAGVVLGAVYEYTQNLVVVSLLHGFYNSMVILFIYLMETLDLEEGFLVDAILAVPGYTALAFF